MTKKSFKGVAYWSVDTKTDGWWAARARDVLLPLEVAGLGGIGYDCIPAGDLVSITMGGEKQELLINTGKGRGVVRPSPVAALFVVCLLALRKSLGDIDVVDDAQQVIPTVPRQNYPLFQESWAQVQALAYALSVVPNPQAAAAMRNLLV